MNLGDLFPDEWKQDYTERNLSVGTVVKLHVKDTNPPKEKRFVIVGFTQDNKVIATLYYNSEINQNVNWSKELIDQHLHFERDSRDYLDKDCYLDCSNLIIKDYDQIKIAVTKKPEAILGELNESDWTTIKNTIIESPTIKGKYKKRYGFYD